LLHEARAQQKIAGKIPNQGELRRDREIGALLPGAPRRLGYQAGVARKIANGRIDLSERDLHEACMVR
jgi:hypothetical protein